MEDNDDILDYTNSDDDAAEEIDSYEDAIKATQEAQWQLTLLESNREAPDDSALQLQREALAQCVLKQQQRLDLVEARRAKEELREKQRRAALAESVPLPPSNAPRPLDRIIDYWQRYAEGAASSSHSQPSDDHVERPKKKARHLVMTPDPLSPSQPLRSLPTPAGNTSSTSPNYPSQLPSKRRRQSSPPRASFPPLALYQTMLEYHEQIISYEPALSKMQELWPDETQWKALFDRLTQLEPDDDSSPVLGEINQAMDLCRRESASRSPNNVEAEAELTSLSSQELVDMLGRKMIPKQVQSVLLSRSSKHNRRVTNDSDIDSGSESEDTELESGHLELEQSLLSKLLGVTTGIDDGIFLVRCMVSNNIPSVSM